MRKFHQITQQRRQHQNQQYIIQNTPQSYNGVILAQQPLAQQPLAQQPLAQQPLAQQPLAQQPNKKQPPPLPPRPSQQQQQQQQTDENYPLVYGHPSISLPRVVNPPSAPTEMQEQSTHSTMSSLQKRQPPTLSEQQQQQQQQQQQPQMENPHINPLQQRQQQPPALLEQQQQQQQQHSTMSSLQKRQPPALSQQQQQQQQQQQTSQAPVRESRLSKFLNKATNMMTAQGMFLQQDMYERDKPRQTTQMTKFFVDLKKKEDRDYILIMDMSNSMRGLSWAQAKHAAMQIAPYACEANENGITLYMFNHAFKRFPNMKLAEEVGHIFEQVTPFSTTNMAGVVRAAFLEHFNTMRPTSVLIVTDGVPDSEEALMDEIIYASRSMKTPDELSLSFIQIGNDFEATHFLMELEDGLRYYGAKYNIVDVVSSMDLGAMSFEQLIYRSIFGF